MIQLFDFIQFQLLQNDGFIHVSIRQGWMNLNAVLEAIFLFIRLYPYIRWGAVCFLRES